MRYLPRELDLAHHVGVAHGHRHVKGRDTVVVGQLKEAVRGVSGRKFLKECNRPREDFETLRVSQSPLSGTMQHGTRAPIWTPWVQPFFTAGQRQPREPTYRHVHNG
jgi:hypothetical protein